MAKKKRGVGEAVSNRAFSSWLGERRRGRRRTSGEESKGEKRGGEDSFLLDPREKRKRKQSSLAPYLLISTEANGRKEGKKMGNLEKGGRGGEGVPPPHLFSHDEEAWKKGGRGSVVGRGKQDLDSPSPKREAGENRGS